MENSTTIEKGSKMKKAENALAASLKIVSASQRNSYLHGRGINPNPAVPIQLSLVFHDLLHDNERFIPNDYARSALFTARNKRAPRRAMEAQEIFHLHNGVTITYTGIELRAHDDEIVWLQILHYGKETPLGQPFEFTIKQLVKDLDWPTNGQYYERARKCISRLNASEIKISNEKAYGLGLANSLIASYTFVNDGDGKPNLYKVWIDRELIYLLAGKTFTNHSWLRYRNYSPIARRLADYAASHRHPHPITLTNLASLCDSLCQNKYKWAQMSKDACHEIVTEGEVKNAWVKDGKIYIER